MNKVISENKYPGSVHRHRPEIYAALAGYSFLEITLRKISILFQLWFFVAQKLLPVRNMFFQPIRRVFQVRKDDFFPSGQHRKNHATKNQS